MNFDQDILPYLMCFGPLAITIILFVLLAVVTDGDSRRTYLRKLPGYKPEPASKAVNAVTPAGVPVTVLPTEGAAETPAAPKPPSPLPDTPDDLTKLEGIGPKMSLALIAAGLDTFAKVAAASLDDFKAAIEAAGMNFAPSAESWSEQAGYAARGDWDGLSTLQDKLESGRYPSSDK